MAELTAAAFGTARVPPLLGRTLLDADERPGAPGVVVLGYDVWHRVLGGRDDVVGSVVTLGNTPATVIGVMPEGFRYPVNDDASTPLPLRASYDALEGGAINVIGRLAPGVTRAQAEAELRVLGDRAAAALPATHEHLRPSGNSELEQSTLEARLNLEAAEARYSNRQVEVERELLNQRATLATTEAQLKTARLQADADGQLFTQGLVSSLQLQQSRSAEQEFDTRYALEQERLQMATGTVEAQLAVEQAEVDRLRTLYELRQQQVADLHVRAGMPGVLQQVPLEEGQRVATGTNLARVGDPAVLKAELRIAETQAKDIQIGQSAAIDTRNGVIPGHVTRIDPAVENGTVTVDVALDGALPRGARPDLTVDGTIELERMDDVLFVGRPVFGQEESVVSLFRVEADGTHASRMRVSLGRASVNTIEVLEGLQPGDRVVLSDMSTWDQFDRVRIE